jgi:hypothetical protein
MNSNIEFFVRCVVFFEWRVRRAYQFTKEIITTKTSDEPSQEWCWCALWVKIENFWIHFSTKNKIIMGISFCLVHHPFMFIVLSHALLAYLVFFKTLKSTSSLKSNSNSWCSCSQLFHFLFSKFFSISHRDAKSDLSEIFKKRAWVDVIWKEKFVFNHAINMF